MFGRYPVVLRLVIFVAFPMVVLSASLYHFYIASPLPSVTEPLKMDGIEGSITIQRDLNGLTIIEADTQIDTYFAMGVAHAQDRLWQLELQKRISHGRLSEIFGKSFVRQDIWIRSLGLEQVVDESEKYLSKAALKSLEAYASGVNSWIESRDRLPVEFSILGIKPSPWEVKDSLLWIKMFALNLSSSYQHEIRRFVGAQYLPSEYRDIFLPELQEGYLTFGVSDKDNEGLLELLANSQKFIDYFHIGGKFVGSNAWVISGKHTTSGGPILANDPHMGLQIPSLWYAVSQSSKDFEVAGMSLVGIPTVIFGQNKFISWGGTNMMADVQDLYFEEINPVNGNQYLEHNEWREFKSRVEIFNVRADYPSAIRAELEPIKVLNRHTSRGPIISDSMIGIDNPISMKWSALDIKDTSYEAFFQLSFAKDWPEFRKALSFHHAPPINMLYADRLNNIGMQGAGKIPIRNEGNGVLPVAAKPEKSSWTGYIPFEEMPYQFNPPEGFLINANDSNTDKDYPHFISVDFATGERATRIEQLIMSKVSRGQKISIDYVKKMQADVKDLSVDNLLSYLKEYLSQNNVALPWKSEVMKWNGVAEYESIGASIYYGIVRNIRKHLFSDELQIFWNKNQHENIMRSLIAEVSPNDIANILSENSDLCDQVSTSKKEGCRNVIDSAIADTIEELIKLKGDNPENWKWGELQATVYKHTPFSFFKVIDSVFSRRIGNGGAANTINVAVGNFDKDYGYQQVFGAGFRQIIELRPEGFSHWYMNSTGQSGQVGSPFFDNMIEPFREVEFYGVKQDKYVKND